MTDRRAAKLFLLGPWSDPAFWDDVDYEIETLDPDDLAEFEAAGRLPIEPRPEFEAVLRRRLQRLFRARYAKA